MSDNIVVGHRPQQTHFQHPAGTAKSGANERALFTCRQHVANPIVIEPFAQLIGLNWSHPGGSTTMLKHAVQLSVGIVEIVPFEVY